MDDNTDEILGITRCARCGHRLEGEIECPFCSMFPDTPKKERVPNWIYVTTCLLLLGLVLWLMLSFR